MITILILLDKDLNYLHQLTSKASGLCTTSGIIVEIITIIVYKYTPSTVFVIIK